MSDLISRQQAIDAIGTWNKFGVDERGRIVRWHEGLEPYVHLRDVLTAIVNLPSAQQERKTGRWTKAYDGNDGHVKCTGCFKTYDWISQAQYYNFCPNCGADMRERRTNE